MVSEAAINKGNRHSISVTGHEKIQPVHTVRHSLSSFTDSYKIIGKLQKEA